VVLDPEGWIMPGQKHRIPFWLNEADLTAKGILLTLAPYAIRYVLETPDGDIIDPGVAGPHPMASFEMGRQVSLYRTGLPIPLGANDAHAGRWHAILTVDEKSYGTTWRRSATTRGCTPRPQRTAFVTASTYTPTRVCA
jgi:hypothetical protein